MSLSNEINNKFWTDPPWGDGHKKYRLGLAPIDKEDWFESDISSDLKEHKRRLLETRYEDVVATTDDSIEAQNILLEKISASENEFPETNQPLLLNLPPEKSANFTLSLVDSKCCLCWSAILLDTASISFLKSPEDNSLGLSRN